MRKRRFWLLPAALLLVLWGLWAAGSVSVRRLPPKETA